MHWARGKLEGNPCQRACGAEKEESIVAQKPMNALNQCMLQIGSG
jgi:hypothetical protein